MGAPEDNLEIRHQRRPCSCPRSGAGAVSYTSIPVSKTWPLTRRYPSTAATRSAIVTPISHQGTSARRSRARSMEAEKGRSSASVRMNRIWGSA
jgi:hypothetical protein